MDVQIVEAAGFVAVPELTQSNQEAADANGMSHNGAYVVKGVWERGQVVLTVEQNTAREDENADGSQITVTHPAVCVVSSPLGSVACNAADTELILALAQDHEPLLKPHGKAPKRQPVAAPVDVNIPDRTVAVPPPRRRRPSTPNSPGRQA